MLSTTAIVIIVTSVLILLGVGFFLLWWFLWRHEAKKVLKVAKIKSDALAGQWSLAQKQHLKQQSVAPALAIYITYYTLEQGNLPRAFVSSLTKKQGTNLAKFVVSNITSFADCMGDEIAKHYSYKYANSQLNKVVQKIKKDPLSAPNIMNTGLINRKFQIDLVAYANKCHQKRVKSHLNMKVQNYLAPELKKFHARHPHTIHPLTGCVYDFQCAGPPCGACDPNTRTCGPCNRVYTHPDDIELCQAHCGPVGPPTPPPARGQKYTCEKCKCVPWKGVGRYFEDSTCGGSCQEAPDCRISYQGYERQSTADMCSAGNCSAYNCKAGDDSCFCMHKCSTMKHPLNFDCAIQGRPPPCPKGGTSSPYFPKK
jgi:hypothetical protein